MVMFSSCPRCTTGDLMKTGDAFGEYLECLQCGYVRDVELDSEIQEITDDDTGKIIEFPSASNNEPLIGA